MRLMGDATIQEKDAADCEKAKETFFPSKVIKTLGGLPLQALPVMTVSADYLYRLMNET